MASNGVSIVAITVSIAAGLTSCAGNYPVIWPLRGLEISKVGIIGSDRYQDGD